MCLQTKQKEPKIAKKDKTVYKILSIYKMDEFRSPFEGFIYKVGKKYSTKIKETSNNCAYDNIANAAKKLNTNYKSYGAGFHSALKKDRLKLDFSNERLVKCIIPAGSKYYVGFSGLVVSNKIIVTGKIIAK